MILPLLPMAQEDLTFQVATHTAPVPLDQRRGVLDGADFGAVFADHVVDICCVEKGGWRCPWLQP